VQANGIEHVLAGAGDRRRAMRSDHQRRGRTLADASVFREVESLEAELAMEREAVF